MAFGQAGMDLQGCGDARASQEASRVCDVPSRGCRRTTGWCAAGGRSLAAEPPAGTGS